MKIAFIHPFQFRLRRGIERFVWELSLGLTKHSNVEIHIITWDHPDPVDWGLQPPNLHIHRVPYFRYYQKFLAIPFYIYWLMREHYDWIILSFAGYGEAEALALLRKLGHRQRSCIVFHYPIEEVPYRYAEFERFEIARRAELLVGVSQFVADGVSKKYDRDCSFINNGVNLDNFQTEPKNRELVREQLNISPQAPVIITLAALEERKGVQWVIRALPHLVTHFPDLQYWVLGDGPYRAKLAQEVQQLGLEHYVRFLGWQDNVAKYLAAADIGCLLSYGEAFGIVLIEYMVSRLPVVASQHPPFPAFINNEWGITVNEQDLVAIANVFQNLLEDDSLRRQMGVAGYQEVQQNYTWEIATDKYLALLES